MISENGSIGFQSSPEEAYIPKLIHKCAKLPQSNRQMLPGWRQSRPLARPYNGLKSSKYIGNMYTFCKLNKYTYSLRPKQSCSPPRQGVHLRFFSIFMTSQIEAVCICCIFEHLKNVLKTNTFSTSPLFCPTEPAHIHITLAF